MRARITFAFVAILALALALAGTVSLFLVRRAANEDAEASVLREARTIVASINEPTLGPLFSENPGLIKLIERLATGGEGSDLVVTTSGRLVSPPPPGVSASAIDTAALARSQASAGVSNGYAFAAVPVLSAAGRVIAISVETRTRSSSGSVGYFLLAGGISLLVAALLAAVISKRIQRPVLAASTAAQQIAGGDFAIRVPSRRYDYPELAGLNASINTMAESLEHAQAGERDFLLSISHDLRTPLTSIRGYAEAIAEGAVEDLPRAAGVLVAEADRLEHLIGDLLDLARLRARRFSFDPVETELCEVVEHAAEALRLAFERAGVKLSVSRPAAGLRLIVDPDRVRQVVSNLLENALKFARTTTEVSLVARGSRMVLTVADDGPGVDPDDLPHIFERLFTSRRNPARAAGTGLGLAIVSELTQAMGGEIEVVSPVNERGGTCISVVLPTAPPKEPAPA